MSRVRKSLPMKCTIEQLASAVFFSDQLELENLSIANIAHVLEIALKSKLGLAALMGEAHIDLGNGHELICVSKVKAHTRAQVA